MVEGRNHAKITARDDLSEWQWDVGVARAWVLDEIDSAAEPVGIGKAERLFSCMAKTGDLEPRKLEMLRLANARRGKNGRAISKASLWRWRELAAGAATPGERIARLAPKTRGKRWTITADEAAALAIYRRPNKPSLSWAVQQALESFGDTTYGALYARCRRVLNRLPKQVFYVGRNSGAALRALQTFRRREFQSLSPNDIWIGDGHSAKLRISHPETGAPFVPEVTIVMDVQSRYVAGWSVALSENCLAVSDAMRHGISRCGVPLIYYSDGGAGQTANMLDAPLTGILPAMGIQHKTGWPGNPQGRGVIERFWPTVLIPLAKRFATYQGRNADRDTLRKVTGEIDRQIRAAQRGEVTALPAKLPTFVQFIEALDAEIEAYNGGHWHRSLPKLDGKQHATPAEYRAARMDGVEIHIPDRAELATLFMPSLLRVAARGEVRLWNGIYFHRDLMLVDAEQVRVCYDIHDASRVLVKKLSGEPIAFAELNGNRSGYMPKPVIEQLREQRAGRRMALLESKMDGVRAEFDGATVTRAAPQAAADTPEEAADRAALAAEMSASNVVALREEADEWAPYRRCTQIEARLAAEGEVNEDERGWYESYKKSSDYRTFKMMAEDFPQKLQEVVK